MIGWIRICYIIYIQAIDTNINICSIKKRNGKNKNIDYMRRDEYEYQYENEVISKCGRN